MSAAVEIDSVSKVFSSRHGPALTALQNVSLQIESGEFFGLLGPNGAGKTTLISILAGLSAASSGAVKVCGYDVATQYRQARAALGVVPQELVFDPFFTVRESLRFQSGYYGLRRNDDWIDELMHHLDLSAKANTNMRALSGGMKRRVLIAQALVHKPPVIVLDEPTAGVDVGLRQTLWKFIQRLNQEGHTVVLTTHYLEEAQALCGRIAMLKAGRIVALDSTKALLDNITVAQLLIRFHPISLNHDGNTLATFRADLVKHLPDGWAEKICAYEFDRLVFNFDDYNHIEPMLKALRSSGHQLEDVQIERADLENVFMRIMHQTDSAVSL